MNNSKFYNRKVKTYLKLKYGKGDDFEFKKDATNCQLLNSGVRFMFSYSIETKPF